MVHTIGVKNTDALLAPPKTPVNNKPQQKPGAAVNPRRKDDIMLNTYEKNTLLKEAQSRSRMIEDTTHYALYQIGGTSVEITTDAKRATLLLERGYKLYCKTYNGSLIL